MIADFKKKLVEALNKNNINKTDGFFESISLPKNKYNHQVGVTFSVNQTNNESIEVSISFFSQNSELSENLNINEVITGSYQQFITALES